MDGKPGVDHLYRLAGEHLQYLFSRHGPGKGKIRVPVRGAVEFQFDPLLPVMGLHGFKGGAADTLIAVEAEGPRVSDTVYTPVLRNERPPGANRFTEGIHETGGIPARKDNLDPVIHKRSDNLDRPGVYPAGRVRYGSVNISQDRLQHGLSPASSTMNGASPSGRLGLSTRRAIRLPALLFLR